MAKRTAIFDVHKSDTSGQYYFKLVAPNGECIATSEMYETLDACLKGVNAVVKHSKKAKLVNPFVS